MGIRGRSERPLEIVELFEVDKLRNELGQYDDALVPLGEFGANVEYFTGSRFAYFKTLGYNRPIQITMYRPTIQFDKVYYMGREIEVKSIAEDKANRNIVVILGDIVDAES